ncbi:MAG: hypothetical protein H5U40_10045 [Polyangiaceae bacterium]|nr:hypothetical protein [Polyangiaceae bacterium]
MLPPFIIEQIRKREDEERRRSDQPVIQLPLPELDLEERRVRVEDEPQRGVVVIDLMCRPHRPE